MGSSTELAKAYVVFQGRDAGLDAKLDFYHKKTQGVQDGFGKLGSEAEQVFSKVAAAIGGSATAALEEFTSLATEAWGVSKDLSEILGKGFTLGAGIGTGLGALNLAVDVIGKLSESLKNDDPQIAYARKMDVIKNSILEMTKAAEKAAIAGRDMQLEFMGHVGKPGQPEAKAAHDALSPQDRAAQARLDAAKPQGEEDYDPERNYLPDERKQQLDDRRKALKADAELKARRRDVLDGKVQAQIDDARDTLRKRGIDPEAIGEAAFNNQAKALVEAENKRRGQSPISDAAKRRVENQHPGYSKSMPDDKRYQELLDKAAQDVMNEAFSAEASARLALAAHDADAEKENVIAYGVPKEAARKNRLGQEYARKLNDQEQEAADELAADQAKHPEHYRPSTVIGDPDKPENATLSEDAKATFAEQEAAYKNQVEAAADAWRKSQQRFHGGHIAGLDADGNLIPTNGIDWGQKNPPPSVVPTRRFADRIPNGWEISPREQDQAYDEMTRTNELLDQTQADRDAMHRPATAGMKPAYQFQRFDPSAAYDAMQKAILEEPIAKEEKERQAEDLKKIEANTDATNGKFDTLIAAVQDIDMGLVA